MDYALLESQLRQLPPDRATHLAHRWFWAILRTIGRHVEEAQNLSSIQVESRHPFDIEDMLIAMAGNAGGHGYRVISRFVYMIGLLRQNDLAGVARVCISIAEEADAWNKGPRQHAAAGGATSTVAFSIGVGESQLARSFAASINNDIHEALLHADGV